MYSEKSNISNKLNNYSISYVNSEKSRLIDEELMGQDIGYSIDQLMEIAGLSVALSIHDVVKNNTEWNNVKKILNISGPGNNGGDGLIASRYLKEFGYDVEIYYPKRTEKDLFLRLIAQCEKYSINFQDDEVIQKLEKYDLIIDSIFGFSFKGDIRIPFDKIINSLNDLKFHKNSIETSTKIASVDIPSGWDVDKGNINKNFTPDLLISLTLPKLCSKEYKGIHYLGGRFVPLYLYQKFNLLAPIYSGSEMVIKLN